MTLIPLQRVFWQYNDGGNGKEVFQRKEIQFFSSLPFLLKFSFLYSFILDVGNRLTLITTSISYFLSNSKNSLMLLFECPIEYMHFCILIKYIYTLQFVIYTISSNDILKIKRERGVAYMLIARTFFSSNSKF